MNDALLPGLWLAFAAGLLGSGHCVGMCGGLVSGCFLRLGVRGRGFAAQVCYHGARISVYVAAGALAAGLGEVLLTAGRFGVVQGVVEVVAGVLMVILGIELLGRLPFALGIGFAPLAWTQRIVAGALERGPLRGAALAGIANGLMPCSLTLAMAVKAAATLQAVEGGVLMLAFGLGTLPSMLAVGVLATRLSAVARSRMQQVGAVFVVIMGAMLVAQGWTYLRVMVKLAA